jgi:aromatic-L-amino-acid/L-tryptophan decarboxylase
METFDNDDTLDPNSPEEWEMLRKQAHKMVDDMFDLLISLRQQKAWQQMPAVCMHTFEQESPETSSSIASVYDIFTTHILPYHSGNIHPGFLGWVQGGGTAIGMMAELLTGALNMNCGGRNHIGIKLEEQVIKWVKSWFQFPTTSIGLFVTGSSMANFIGLLTAKTNLLGIASREYGWKVDNRECIVYTSSEAHDCVKRGMEMSGGGSICLKVISVDPLTHEMNLRELQQAIDATKLQSDKFIPMMVIGTAGTVDTGAIDNLLGISKYYLSVLTLDTLH